VILWDRPDRLYGERSARTLAEKHRVLTRYVGVELNDLAGTEATARSIAEEYDGVDILINNAALIINRPFEAFSLEEYEEQVRVNSSAAFALARAVAPSMKRKRYGKIINFCSITLNGRWDGYVPYVTSKGAMLGLSKALARELGPHGVRVNAISPGAVVSEAEARVFGDRLKQYNDWILENQCLKERIQPSAIADLVVFLVSPASDMITGQIIAIDGGW
jgi:NAD(P)-dependent dehydrogenase (short-subunit alcohol dehydrogenase family)